MPTGLVELTVRSNFDFDAMERAVWSVSLHPLLFGQLRSAVFVVAEFRMVVVQFHPSVWMQDYPPIAPNHLLLRTRLGRLGFAHKVFGLPASPCAGSQSAALYNSNNRLE